MNSIEILRRIMSETASAADKTALVDGISALERMTDKIRENPFTCPTCGKVMLVGSSYCRHCGQRSHTDLQF